MLRSADTPNPVSADRVAWYGYFTRLRPWEEGAVQTEGLDVAPAARPMLATSVLEGKLRTFAPRYPAEERSSSADASLRPSVANPPITRIANATPLPYGSAPPVLL